MQKTKKADSAPKTNSNPNFESSFGFLVKFDPIPELGCKKSGLELKKNEFIPVFFISGPLCIYKNIYIRVMRETELCELITNIFIPKKSFMVHTILR
jgi:hypothetical protein